jgi:chorismate mutase / prephenate dehydratase
LAREAKGRYSGDMNDAVIPSDPQVAALEAIRRDIDGVDSQLLILIAERLRLSDRMVALKAPAPGLPIRSGREAILLRQLLANATPPLERELVLEVWRALIAASLRRQRVIDVVVGGGRGDPTRLFDIARRHFGARTRITHVGDAQAALQRVVDSPDTIVAVTSWPAAPGVGAWWPALSERRFHHLHVIAGLPLTAPVSEEPEAAVFAASPPDEAGGDATMILAFDPHHRVTRALNEVGFVGKEVARAEPRVLVRVEGFVAPEDPRVAALTRYGLDNARVLGSYARV